MARFFPVVLTLLASTAFADTTITFRGAGPGTQAPHAFIDGSHVGQVRPGSKGLAVTATPGVHEVWLSHDSKGLVTWCRGSVELKAEGSTTVSLDKPRHADLVCEGTSKIDVGVHGGVAFTLTRGLAPWISVDGDAPVLLARRPFLLHLSPGAHDLVLFEDVMEDIIIAEQRIDVSADDALLTVHCSVGGCQGFDTAPTTVAGREGAGGEQAASR